MDREITTKSAHKCRRSRQPPIEHALGCVAVHKSLYKLESIAEPQQYWPHSMKSSMNCRYMQCTKLPDWWGINHPPIKRSIYARANCCTCWSVAFGGRRSLLKFWCSHVIFNRCPFIIDAGGVTPNIEPTNRLHLFLVFLTTGTPPHGSPSWMAKSWRVIVHSPCGIWNVWVYGSHRSMSALIKPGSNVNGTMRETP